MANKMTVTLRDWPDEEGMDKEVKEPFDGALTIHNLLGWELLTFSCPCGCDVRFWLNLDKRLSESPCWSVVQRDPLTVTPSINLLSGCRSHFWIRDGAIVWC